MSSLASQENLRLRISKFGFGARVWFGMPEKKYPAGGLKIGLSLEESEQECVNLSGHMCGLS